MKELELIGFKQMTPSEEQQIQDLLSACIIVPLNTAIKKRYVEVRRVHHLKLADAIIAATALALDIPLTQKSH